MTSKTFHCFGHQDKGREYTKALESAGFTPAPCGEASVILMDYDVKGRINQVKAGLESGRSKLFIYPHAAHPNIGWDGLISRTHYAKCVFVSAEGHIEILRRIGVEAPIVVSGWSYCQMRPFRENEHPQKILFAPIHPTRRGFLPSIDREINLKAFERLEPLKGIFDITIRHIHTLESNGIPRVSGIEYVDGATNCISSTEQIDGLDVVIGSRTIAYIAVARGVPTIMMGEDVPPHLGTAESNVRYVQNFEKYKDLLIYPMDILKEDDTIGLVYRSARSDSEIADWRNRMIGFPFAPESVVDAVLSFL